MADALRDGDRVYRYGGDEFAVLLPGISGGAVREVIERIRAAVARLTEETGPDRDDQRRRRALPRRRAREGRPRRGRRPGAVPRQAGRPPAPRHGRPDPRPVPRGHRPDDAPPARAARARASCCARSSTAPRAWSASSTASCTCSRTTTAARTSCAASASGCSTGSTATACPHGHRDRLDGGPVGPADERRRLRRLPDARRAGSTPQSFGAVCARAADLGRRGARA